MNKIEQLQSRYSFELENEANILELINTREADNAQMSSWIDTLWYCNQVFAFKSLLVDEDSTKAKEYFYICGLLFEAMAQLSNIYNESNVFMAFHNRLSYALVSDNTQLIDRLSFLRGTFNERYIKEGSLMITMQYAIRDNWSALAQMMDVFNKRIDKNREMWRINDRDFFAGLLKRDVGQIEQALSALISPRVHKKRNLNELYGEFVSHPALGYAKLAWMKGLYVQVSSQLIPQELLMGQFQREYINPYSFLNKII